MAKTTQQQPRKYLHTQQPETQVNQQQPQSYKEMTVALHSLQMGKGSQETTVGQGSSLNNEAMAGFHNRQWWGEEPTFNPRQEKNLNVDHKQ